MSADNVEIDAANNGRATIQGGGEAVASASTPPLCPNLDHARRFLTALMVQGFCLEIRIFEAEYQRGIIVRDNRWKNTFAGYFDSVEKMLVELQMAKGVSVYCTINPVKSHMMARVNSGKIQKVGKGEATSDEDIICLRYIYIDLDPKRPKGISATAEERDKAIARRDKILADHPEIRASSFWGTSGNGCWILVRLPDLPNDEENNVRVAKFLGALGDMYTDDDVEIDQSTKNPSRVMGVVGFVKCKGTSRPDRPWRLSTFDSPDDHDLTPFDLAGWLNNNVRPDPVVSRNGSTAKNSRVGESVASKGESKGAVAKGDPSDADWTNARLAESALECLKARASKYKEWLDVGMALSELGPEGLKIWDSWSKHAPDKYESGACETKWATFSTDPNGLKLGSLFKWANDAGWRFPATRVQDAESTSQPIGTAGQPPSPEIERNGLGTPRNRLLPDTPVKAMDCDNLGTVVRDIGEVIDVQFKSPEGAENTVRFERSALCNPDGRPLDSATGTPAEPFELKVIGTSVFIRADFRREWLIKRVMVKGRPGVIGGPQKCMKTSITIDLLVSLACAGKFFGCFEVPRRTKVLLISGESGAAVVQETCRRVCLAKGIDPDEMEGYAFWGFDLPRLDSREQLRALAKFIRENEIEVVILDPLYLCLLTGGHAIDPANLFDIGPLLKTITETCLDAGATPLLVHHFRKNRENPNGPPELEDLSFSGIQEFARQWLLITRRDRYEPGSGDHRLWFSVGGSDGHSGEWAVDISEGTVDEDFRDRQWLVSVNGASEARSQVKLRQEETKAAKLADKEKKKAEDEARKQCDKVETALADLRKVPDGLSQNQWRNRIGLSGAKMAPIVATLLKQGRIKETTVTSRGTDGKSRTSGGFQFVTSFIQESTPDNPGQPRTGT
jgi:AAA domain/Primase C terminal 2 (PriCT-2)